MCNNKEMDQMEPVRMPITGELDLHTFHPRDLGDLLPEYLLACRRAGILEVRIIHGKGSGTLRKGVVALLDHLPEVIRHRPGGMGEGAWGATLVDLRPLPEPGQGEP